MSRGLREGRMSGGRACRAQGTVNVKALRKVYDWHAQGIARRPARLRGDLGRAAREITPRQGLE